MTMPIEDEKLDRNYKNWSFMARNLAEEAAAFMGYTASEALLSPTPAVGIHRLKALHLLRIAAKICPAAAYTLGNFFAEARERRPKRAALSLTLFERAFKKGLERLPDPGQPFDGSRVEEQNLRDIISRSITNIGVDFANAKRDPVTALSYFRLGVRIFPDNANAHLCAGRMIIFFNEKTAADPLDGLEAWLMAAKLEKSCLDGTYGCGCLANMAGVVAGVRDRYGDEAARSYLLKRVPKRIQEADGFAFKPVVASPADLPVAGLAGISKAAAEASEHLKIISAALGTSKPLEMRVTLAATILAALSVIDGRKSGDDAMIDKALQRCKPFEPLTPYLGDHQWEYVTRPNTNYLADEKTVMSIVETSSLAVDFLKAKMPKIKPEDAMVGFLFHVDPLFRKGITGMAKSFFEYARHRGPMLVYVPAYTIGNEAQHGYGGDPFH